MFNPFGGQKPNPPQGHPQQAYPQQGYPQQQQGYPQQQQQGYPQQQQQGYPQQQMAEDDESRDYRLEAIDDVASFDVWNDLGAYFLAEFRIERAWEDRDERRTLFQTFGIRSVQHYYQVKATLERFMQSPQAQQRHGSIHDMMHVKMRTTQDFLMGGLQASTQAGGKLAGEMEPVAGVTLESWAGAMAYIAQSGTLDNVLRELAIDGPTWEKVSAEWNARMSRDTTAAIATAYGQAFVNGSTGRFSGAAQAGVANMQAGGAGKSLGGEPCTLEAWIEMGAAMEAASAQGQDPQAALAKLGFTIVDYSQISSWWSANFANNAMRDEMRLFNEHTRLTEKYRAKYGL